MHHLYLLSKIINIKLILTCLLGDAVFFNSYIASVIKICLSFVMKQCIRVIQGLNTDLGQSLESLHWIYYICWLVLAVNLTRVGIIYESGRHTSGYVFQELHRMLNWGERHTFNVSGIMLSWCLRLNKTSC